MPQNCDFLTFFLLRVVFLKKFKKVDPIYSDIFLQDDSFKRYGVQVGLTLIPRFWKNTFWNCHTICSSKICCSTLIHFFYFVFPLRVAVRGRQLSWSLGTPAKKTGYFMTSCQRMGRQQSQNMIMTRGWMPESLYN